MPNSLHRRILVAIFVAQALLLTPLLSGQYTGQIKSSRMRAVGILAIDPKGKARLFPITLCIDGKFYDARFYEANPVPLAIAGNILYQAQKDGVAEGNFTVETAMRTPTQWWAEGKWHPGSGPGSAPVGGKSAKAHSDADDGRPVLHRPSPATADADDPDRPVLRKPSPASDAGASPSGNSPSANPAGGDATQQREQEDPSRPTLHRGKPEHQQQPDIPASTPVAGVAHPSTVVAAPTISPKDKVMLAVADAGMIESHSYAYPWPEEERKSDLLALNALAGAAIRKAAKGRSDLRGADPAKLTGVEVYALDPDYSNRPIEVFTASVAGATSKTWLPPGSEIRALATVNVTIVARKDTAGRLNQIFAMVSDPTMLDVRPSLQFLGAVDPDGSGRAQLLFHKQVDVNSFAYVLYRATSYDLVKTFETKAAE